MAELVHVAGFDGGDELIDKCIARQIQDARIRRSLQHLLADRLQQMRFAQPHTSMHK